MVARTSLSAPALRSIQGLGQRIRVARTRRRLTIVALAAKAGINRNTLNALELGKPGVAHASYVNVLFALGLDRTLEGVADPDTDVQGKALEASRQPARVRKPKESKYEDDFGAQT